MEHDQIRKSVSRVYAGAVSRPSTDSSRDKIQKGCLVQHAGYTPEELGSLPTEAVVNSFGCGNPLAFSEIGEGETVVDLGSGAGIDLLLAAKKVGPSGRVIGIDMTDEMIAKAREVIAESGLANVEVRKGLIEKLPVDSASVDWVISNCVINLSPEKDRVFSEIARILKPGGRMLVSDVVAEQIPECVRENEELYCSCIAGAIDEEAYCDGLRKAGLENVEIRERIHYDAGQVEALIASELGASEATGGGCCSSEPSTTSLNVVTSADEAKVWSAKIFAQKPA